MQNWKWNNFYIMHFCQDSIVKAVQSPKRVGRGTIDGAYNAWGIHRHHHRTPTAAHSAKSVTWHFSATDGTKKKPFTASHNTQLTSFVGVKSWPKTRKKWTPKRLQMDSKMDSLGILGSLNATRMILGGSNFKPKIFSQKGGGSPPRPPPPKRAPDWCAPYHRSTHWLPRPHCAI